MKKLYTINVISDSAFTVQGHGVHTAYTEHLAGLKKYSPAFEVHTNQKNFHADIVHIHTVGFYGLRFLLSRGGLKFVSAHVVPDSFIGSLVGAKLWYPLAKWYLRWFYNHADGVFAVSHEVAGQLKQLRVTKPTYVVPNMIETAEFANSTDKKASARRDLKIGKDKFVVVCSGQVQPRKRVDSFMACAKNLPEIEFIWVGGIPFKRAAANYKEMQRLMDTAPPNVHFTGVIEHKDVIAYYLASDMFFLPSEQETFGIVIIEGAAADLPVLLRDNEQYHITFKDWYEKASSDQGFTDIIKKLSTDKNYYLRAQTKAKNIVKAYDTKNVMLEINKIYLEYLEQTK
ncbi:glycosyltransferase [Candidatus Saccharibacteria bacterium]|nr:glycosyltransferase [Candidatus Saccharibacteria bacterium]